MTLLAGTVTVTAGVASGTGFAKALYDARLSALGITPGPQNHAGLAEMAKVCNADSTVITYFVSNAVVSTTDTGTATLGGGVVTACGAGAGTATGTAPVTATGTGTIS
jgi:hypothetical protein